MVEKKKINFKTYTTLVGKKPIETW